VRPSLTRFVIPIETAREPGNRARVAECSSQKLRVTENGISSPMKPKPQRDTIPWKTSKRTNAMGLSWMESRYIEGGLRCSRSGRSYYSISKGKDWRSVDCARNAKIEFHRGATLDVNIHSRNPAKIQEVLRFAFKCLCDSPTPPPLQTPIIEFYPKKMKHLIFCVRYYEPTHPEFGRYFSGEKPTVSIAKLAEMIVDARNQKGIRIPPKALRFDPND
jgi:hypothetical protein